MSVYNPAVDSASMLVSTRDNLEKGKWFSELQSETRYPLCEILMDDGLAKSRVGKKLTFRASDDPGTPKPRTGWYQTYTADKHTVLYEAEMPWRNGEETCAIDKREIAANSGEAQVVDENELNLRSMYQRVCESVELAAVTIPAVGDSLNEVGFPYFINCPSNASGGFQGTVPAGYTLVSNLDPVTAHPRYRNWADLYVDFTPDDFGVKASQMFRKINFHTPPKGKDEGNPMDALRCYMGTDTMGEWELMQVFQNDQLGNDSLPMFEKSFLKGISPVELPMLDTVAAAGSMPLYFVNHNTLYPVFLMGYRFMEIASQPIPMSLMIHWAIFWTYNWECKSRRRQGVMAKSAPFGEGAFS